MSSGYGVFCHRYFLYNEILSWMMIVLIAFYDSSHMFRRQPTEILFCHRHITSSLAVVVVGAVVAIVAVTIVIVVCSTTDIDLKEESKIGHDISISFRFGRKKGQGHGTGEKPNLFPFCIRVSVWVCWRSSVCRWIMYTSERGEVDYDYMRSLSC